MRNTRWYIITSRNNVRPSITCDSRVGISSFCRKHYFKKDTLTQRHVAIHIMRVLKHSCFTVCQGEIRVFGAAAESGIADVVCANVSYKKDPNVLFSSRSNMFLRFLTALMGFGELP